MVSAVGALLDNVWIDRFRSPRGEGCGLCILNSKAGNCWRCRFDHVDIANCDTGLLTDSLRPDYSCSYMTFTALTIHQEHDCVVLKNSEGNGSIYNRFFGLTMQVTRDPGGNFLVIEGRVNQVVSLVIDDGHDYVHHIRFRTGASGQKPQGNRVSGGNFQIRRVKDDNDPETGFNTLDHSGTFWGGRVQHSWSLNGHKVAGLFTR